MTYFHVYSTSVTTSVSTIVFIRNIFGTDLILGFCDVYITDDINTFIDNVEEVISRLMCMKITRRSPYNNN